MKLEVGMYVRTKEGYICKILKLNEPFEDDGYLDHNDIGSPSIQEKNVIKASHNIIDLVEVGDYVNGHKVLGINLNLKWWDDESGEQDELEGIKLESYGYIYPNSNYYFELKSIVTKEQFEAMVYKVGVSNE